MNSFELNKHHKTQSQLAQKCQMSVEYCGAKYNEYNECNNPAEYICSCCNKNYCVNDMYLMCDKCYKYVLCYSCGRDRMYEAIKYCVNADKYCKYCSK